MAPQQCSPAAVHRVAVLSLNREIACSEDETLFHAARRHGVRLLGACGSCTVRLIRGEALLDGETVVGPGGKWRRACRLKPRRDCEAEIAPRSLAPVARAEVEAKDWLGDVAPAPAVRAFDVRVAEPSLTDPRGDFERLVEALSGVRAIDLAEAVGRREEDIFDVAVCGNTAMQHLLLDLPVGPLARAPFVAATSGALDVEARDLGLALAPSARVHAAPGVGGFVGSDHVAALLATRARWDGDGATLVMDIGANTEISLASGGRIFSASCPSGPALEGGNIACGMRAAEGAIERVGIESGALVVTTIGGGEAVGVCGSGVLDAIAAALRLGLLNSGGRIRDHGEGVVRVDGRPAIALAPDVRILQADVRAVQLAKAAIRTGVDLLLDLCGLAEREVDRFVLAGAFGQYVDVANAIAIGLLPPLPLARYAQVGNAAGVGVARMLASTVERERAAAIAARCRYVELNTHPQFQKRFMNNIGFAEDASAQGDEP
jgi:uncharacterized 2Fe-2S/4Fe-4S cluster protein (DUF4445 family)